MKTEDRVFVWSYNPKNRIADNIGKWIVRGSLRKMRSSFETIDRLVDQGRIHKAKYTHKRERAYDPLPFDRPVMIIYADEETRDRVHSLLESIGIKPDEWKYDAETREDWKPGGKLYERSRQQRFIADYYRFRLVDKE